MILTSANNITVPETLRVWEAALVGIILVIMILMTVVGNVFVILAILLERELQRPQYYLILSLSCADLMVGVLVSPLATIYEIERSWYMGVVLCDFWISVDVLACTASILHLVAIALDRYWAVTDVSYSRNRTRKRIGFMIVCVWVASLLVSVPPMLGWKDGDYNRRVLTEYRCLYSQDLAYQIFSTTAAFYGPLIIIIVLYWGIFKEAKTRIRNTAQKRMSTARRLSECSQRQLSVMNADDHSPAAESRPATPPPQFRGENSLKPPTTDCGHGVAFSVEGEARRESCVNEATSVLICARRALQRRRRSSDDTRRERKAWRTLVIITGTFVGCWLPFFVLAIARPICSTFTGSKCESNSVMQSVFLWLGYLNSAVNPVIYTIFSPDFRQAFKKIVRRLYSRRGAI